MNRAGLLIAAAPLALMIGMSIGSPASAAEVAAEADAGTTVEAVEVTGRRDINLDHPQETGSRLGLSALETPASVEVIDGDTVRERGDLSTQEAVSRITGFTSVGTPGDGGMAVTARGFSGLGSVMQLYDGQRLYVAAGTITFPFDPWTVDRIEALRGPASVMFGEGAIGGAINIVPKHANPDMRSGEYQLGFGSYNTWRVGVGAGGPISGPLSYRLDASYNTSDNWVQRSDSHSTAVSGELRFQASPNLVVTLRDDYGDQHPMIYFGTPLINHQLLRDTLKTNYDVLDAVLHYTDNWTQLKADWTPSESISIKNTLYRMTSVRHWRNAETYVWIGGDILDRTDGYIAIKHDQTQVGDRAEATFRSDLGGMKNNLAVGAEANSIKFTHTNNGFVDDGTSQITAHNPDVGLFLDHSVDPTPRYHTDSDQYALFAEDQLQLTDQLSLVGGLRFDNFKFNRQPLPAGTPFGKTFRYTDWRIGTVYQPSKTLSFYAQYATGSDPLGSLVTTSASTVARDFDLSTAWQAEVGVKQIFADGRGQWTLAAYDIDKKKLLATIPGHVGQTALVGERSAKGVEGTLILTPAEGWTIEANAAYVDAKYENFVQGSTDFSGNTPPGVPKKTANLQVAYRFAPGWQGRVGVRYVGELFNNDANTLVVPDYTVVDLGLDWRVRDNATISLRAANIFDETYAQATYADEQWIIGRPRTFEISVHGRF